MLNFGGVNIPVPWMVWKMLALRPHIATLRPPPLQDPRPRPEMLKRKDITQGVGEGICEYIK